MKRMIFAVICLCLVRADAQTPCETKIYKINQTSFLQQDFAGMPPGYSAFRIQSLGTYRLVFYADSSDADSVRADVHVAVLEKNRLSQQNRFADSYPPSEKDKRDWMAGLKLWDLFEICDRQNHVLFAHFAAGNAGHSYSAIQIMNGSLLVSDVGPAALGHLDVYSPTKVVTWESTGEYRNQSETCTWCEQRYNLSTYIFQNGRWHRASKIRTRRFFDPNRVAELPFRNKTGPEM